MLVVLVLLVMIFLPLWRELKLAWENRRQCRSVILTQRNDDECRSAHALKLLSSLQSLRENEAFHDFTIRVGDQSFPAHRTVLAACSEYFRAMLSHDMKESREGVVVMRDVDPTAVGLCLNFMYTGQVEISHENAENVLHVSAMMQLTEMAEICFRQLQKNLSLQNCFKVKNLADMYNCEEVADRAEEYLVTHFNSFSETAEFSHLEPAEIRRYAANPLIERKTCWMATLKWIKHDVSMRENVLLDFMKVIGVDQFSPKFLFEAVWRETLVKNSAPCTKFALSHLFSDVNALASSLTFLNYFQIINAIRNHELRNAASVHVVVKRFMQENFNSITVTTTFKSLEEDDVLALFQAPERGSCSQIAKWFAALRWIQANPKQEKLFVALLETIDIERLSKQFIQRVVRQERMVQVSHRCKDIVMDSLCNGAGVQAVSCENLYVAIIDRANSKIWGYDLLKANWNYLDVCIGHEDPKIASINHKIYTLVGKTLRRSSRHTCSENVVTLNHEPSTEAKLVVFEGLLYLIEKDVTSYYDPAKNVWVEGLTGCGQDEGFCVAASEEHIFVFGACEMKYDPRTDTWLEIPPPLFPRVFATAAVLGRSLYLMGGCWQSERNEVQMYDLETAAWTKAPDLALPGSHLCSCVVDNRLYVFGRKVVSTSCHLQVLNVENNRWERVCETKTIRFPTSACAAVFEKKYA